MIRDATGNIDDANEFAYLVRDHAEDMAGDPDAWTPNAPLRCGIKLPALLYILDHREEHADLTRALQAKYEFAATYERQTTLRLRAVA